MHRAALWQQSSNTNIKIVDTSIEHFVWNPFDFSSNGALFSMWIVSTNSVVQVSPQKIFKRVEILGIVGQAWSVWWDISLSHAKLCLSHSSLLLEKWDVISFLKQSTWKTKHKFPWDRLNLSQAEKPWPPDSHYRNPTDHFFRGYLKDRPCENNSQAR